MFPLTQAVRSCLVIWRSNPVARSCSLRLIGSANRVPDLVEVVGVAVEDDVPAVSVLVAVVLITQ